MGVVKQTHDVIVIGGGSAGMMAAIIAARRGKRVLLLEKNKKLGEKLRISGGGRCNILNAEENTRELLSHFGDAAKFLFSPFSQFGMQESWDFFESQGLLLKVEEKKRAFPASESAEEVCAFFETLLQEAKVEVRKNIPVEELVKRSGRIRSVRAGNQEFAAATYILATGGVSHPETGSTGEGFAWLKHLGHEVLPPKPTIVPLQVEEKWIRALSGTSLTNARITFEDRKKKTFSRSGSILLTHFGLSGPIILNSAAKVDDMLHEGIVRAHIDIFPDLDIGALDTHIQKIFEQNKNKSLKNTCKEFVPPGTADAFLEQAKLDGDVPVHSVTKEERRALVDFLKDIQLTITGLMGLERAVVADGGVSLVEIETRTMQSKVCDNLYVVGDLLNITRPSGGYSLQLCWTTGYVAGANA